MPIHGVVVVDFENEACRLRFVIVVRKVSITKSTCFFMTDENNPVAERTKVVLDAFSLEEESGVESDDGTLSIAVREKTPHPFEILPPLYPIQDWHIISYSSDFIKRFTCNVIFVGKYCRMQFFHGFLVTYGKPSSS